MKRTATTLSIVISVVVLFSTLANASVTAGNWYLQASSQVIVNTSQIPQLGGSLTQTDSTISGVLHVSNSVCFDWATDIPLSGSVSGNTVTLTSASITGQVITITGSANSGVMSGNYTITAGCADGDSGTVSAILVPLATGTWNGSIASNGTNQPAALIFSQDVPNPDGYSPLSGTITIPGSQCFVSGTLVTDQSWSLGNIIQAVVTMSDGSQLMLNGFVTDVSTAATHITLNFSVTGGNCSGQSGSATFDRQ